MIKKQEINCKKNGKTVSVTLITNVTPLFEKMHLEKAILDVHSPHSLSLSPAHPLLSLPEKTQSE